MLPPLQRLIDRSAGGDDVLSPALAEWYGGALLLPEPRAGAVVVGNFVQTVDGVTALPGPGPDPLFGEPNDRLLMSVLRAWSDAVVIGRATLDAGTRRATWHWKTTVPRQPPDARTLLEDLERRLARRRPHWNVIVSASGDGIDFGRAVFHDPDVHAVLCTTRAGAARAREGIAAAGTEPRVEIWHEEAPGGGVDLDGMLDRLAASGRPRVLVEGGPTLYGALESRRRVDELFLTVRGLVGGAGPGRLASFSAHPYAPGESPRLDLVSARVADDATLFTRWRYRH